MINSEELDRDLLDRGLITREQFDANQRMREKQADDAARRCWMTWGSGAYSDAI